VITVTHYPDDPSNQFTCIEQDKIKVFLDYSPAIPSGPSAAYSVEIHQSGRVSFTYKEGKP